MAVALFFILRLIGVGVVVFRLAVSAIAVVSAIMGLVIALIVLFIFVRRRFFFAVVVSNSVAVITVVFWLRAFFLPFFVVES